MSLLLQQRAAAGMRNGAAAAAAAAAAPSASPLLPPQPPRRRVSPMAQPAAAQRGLPPAIALGHIAGSRTRHLVVAHGASKQSLFTQLRLEGSTPSPGFDSIEDALEDLAHGKFVIVLDDEDRENEGDLIINADKVTTEAMAFMVEHTSGVICISMPGDDLDRLELPLMVTSKENDESMYTAFAVTVDLRRGTSTGISAADRAATLRALADPASRAGDFRRPGHIFPLRYRPGGVIVRPGHTEAAVDLARASGSRPAGVLCEIVDRRDGSMARTPTLQAFAREHGLRCVTIADLIRHRLRAEQLLERVAEAPLETRHGLFVAHCFRSTVDGAEHVALVAAGSGGSSHASSSSSSHASSSSSSDDGAEPPRVLTRVQLQQPLLDVFGSLHCGQGPFLDEALAALAAAPQGGVLLYVQGHDDDGARRGGSLAGELQAHARSQEACSTSGRGAGGAAAGGGAGGDDDGGALLLGNRAGPSSSLSSDLRDAAAAAHMLRHLGVGRVALLGGDEAEAARLRCCGVDAQVAAGGGLRNGAASGAVAQLHAMLGGSGAAAGSSSSNGVVGAGRG